MNSFASHYNPIRTRCLGALEVLPTEQDALIVTTNGHGAMVALVEAQDSSVVSHRYDAFGQLTSASENFGSGTTWTNPYRYDGRDGVRYDGETGLYWMSVRVYDPALGRFLSRGPISFQGLP